MVSRVRKQLMRDMHEALLDVVTTTNLPTRDVIILEEAGVDLDRTLFPLLVGVDRYGPIGVGDLADRAGRDYTTVSRQVAKLEGLGLVERRRSPEDRRVTESTCTEAGRDVLRRIGVARLRLGEAVFEQWSDRDLRDLGRLMRRYVDDATSAAPFSAGAGGSEEAGGTAESVG